MKTLMCALLTLLAAGALSGCAGGSTAATAAASVPAQTAPAAVIGVNTPKSVSVVTAN